MPPADGHSDPRFARLHELAADRAASGLPPAEEAELHLLLDELGPAGDQIVDQYEAAAAAASVALIGADRPALPAALRARLLEHAGRARPRLAPLLDDAHDHPADRTARVDDARRRRFDWRIAGGWMAAAASLLFALAVWQTRPVVIPMTGDDRRLPLVDGGDLSMGPPAPVVMAGLPGVGNGGSVPAPIAPVQPSRDLNAAARALANFEPPELRLTGLKRSGQPFVTVPLLRPTAGSSAVGEITWFPQRQEGFLDLHDVPTIEAPGDQYQLWIFDALRDDRYPVDGGVFNVPAGQKRVLLPFAARLPVADATSFALTIERAGGVVVSARDRIIAAGVKPQARTAEPADHTPEVPRGGPLQFDAGVPK